MQDMTHEEVALASIARLTSEVREYARQAALYAVTPMTADEDSVEWYHESGFKAAVRRLATDLYDMVESLPSDDDFAASLRHLHRESH